MHMSRMFSGSSRSLRISHFWSGRFLMISLGLMVGVWGNGLLLPVQSHAALPSAFVEGFSEIVEKDDSLWSSSLILVVKLVSACS